MPPSSCKLIENVLFSSSAKPSAPTFITSEAMPGYPGLLGRGGVGTEEFPVDGAGEQVRRRDRHDAPGRARR